MNECLYCEHEPCDCEMIATGPCAYNADPHPREARCIGWRQTTLEPAARWDRDRLRKG